MRFVLELAKYGRDFNDKHSLSRDDEAGTEDWWNHAELLGYMISTLLGKMENEERFSVLAWSIVVSAEDKPQKEEGVLRESIASLVSAAEAVTQQQQAHWKHVFGPTISQIESRRKEQQAAERARLGLAEGSAS